MKTVKDKQNRKFNSGETTGVYEILPRFVDELPKADKHNAMPAVEREFEYNGQQYVLIIHPANPIRRAVHGLPNDPRTLYPGPQEERVERALRKLTAPGSYNFDVGENELYFTLTDIAREYALLFDGAELTRWQLDLSLFILYESRYIIQRNRKEFYFGPIDVLKAIEHNGEIRYLVVFHSIFFNVDRYFERVFGEGA